MKKFFTVKLISRFIFLIFYIALVGYIVFSNIAPFGITAIYSITELGPKDRVSIVKVQGQDLKKQTNDLIYFTTKMPFKFDTAKVRILFSNQFPDQELRLGFQDQKDWHYDSSLIEAPILNNPALHAVGNGPVLYQKEKKYASVEEFFKNLPFNDVIGVYDYDAAKLTPSRIKLPGVYTQKKSDTVINVPLRGKHTLYVYLMDEPFRVKITKQDLNWYQDPDVATIKVYKDTDNVFTATIDDDGISDSSKRITQPQEVMIQNPGPGLPENGLYKIVIDAPRDSIIKEVRTNLHKIVFEGPIFIANNTKSTTLYTNAQVISAKTNHPLSFQDIDVGGQILSIYQAETEELITPQETFTRINIPKGDVILNGIFGYFAFDEDQFFRPTPYKILTITKKDDINLANYIISTYEKPKDMGGGWRMAEAEFDLSNAFVKNSLLSWIISAPKLKENKRSILIKDIEVEFRKKPFDIKLLKIWK